MDTDGLEIRFVMSTNADDPAGVQKEQDVKPRLSQLQLPGASNAARAASQSRVSATPGPGVRPQSTPRGIGGAATTGGVPTRKPLFRPAEEEDETADDEAKLWHEVDDDDDDEAFVVAASQAVDAVDRQRATQTAPLTQNGRDDAPPAAIDVDETERTEVQPAGTQPEPDIIDMSLDDSGDESNEASAVADDSTRKRQRKVRLGWLLFDGVVSLKRCYVRTGTRA